MEIYRIEHKDTLDGMWTKKIENKLVLEFLEDKRLLNLPMPDDEIFRWNGKTWKTAVADLRSLGGWFTIKEVFEMTRFGFLLKKIEMNPEDLIVRTNQILFDDSKRTKEINITNEYLSEKFNSATP